MSIPCGTNILNECQAVFELCASLCGVESLLAEKRPPLMEKWNVAPTCPDFGRKAVEKVLPQLFQHTSLVAILEDMKLASSGSTTLDAVSSAGETLLCDYMNEVDLISRTECQCERPSVVRFAGNVVVAAQVLGEVHRLFCSELHGSTGDQVLTKLFQLSTLQHASSSQRHLTQKRLPFTRDDASPTATLTVPQFLFMAAIAPLATFIERWMVHGILDDPCCEYFISVDHTALSLASIMDDSIVRVAGSRYLASAQRCPEFLRPIAYQLVHAGAYRAMLNDSDEVDHLLSHNFGTSSSAAPAKKTAQHEKNPHLGKPSDAAGGVDRMKIVMCIAAGANIGSCPQDGTNQLSALVTQALMDSSAAVMVRLHGKGELRLHVSLINRVVFNELGDWDRSGALDMLDNAAGGAGPVAAWRQFGRELGGEDSALGALFFQSMLPSAVIVNNVAHCTMQYVPPPYIHLVVTPEAVKQVGVMFHWLNRWRVAMATLRCSGFSTRRRLESLNKFASSASVPPASRDLGLSDISHADRLFLFSLHGAANRILLHALHHYAAQLAVDLETLLQPPAASLVDNVATFSTVEDCRLALTQFIDGVFRALFVDDPSMGISTSKVEGCSFCLMVESMESITHAFLQQAETDPTQPLFVTPQCKAAIAKCLQTLCSSGDSVGTHIDLR